MGAFRWLDALVIVAYMATLIGVGVRFSRRQTSTERYFVAKRSIPGWAMGLSLLATLISSVTFVAYPGSAYAGDWSNLVPGLTVLVVVMLVALVIIPFYRHVVGMSVYEYFGKRFGYGARVYGSIGFSLGHFSKMGVVFYLLALTVTSMTGWSTDRVIILVGVITIGYTLIGGIEAVIWADVIQGFVLWLGIIICLGYLLFLPPGGPTAILHTAWQSHKISLGSTVPDLSKPTILTLALYGFFFYLQRYTADQTVVQRYLVAHTDRAAIRGMALGSLLCIPVWTLFMLIGTLCWAFYKTAGERLPVYVTKADQVFPYFVVSRIPHGLAGLFLAALFGAAMANLSSDFNSLAAIGVEDYYRVMRPESSERGGINSMALVPKMARSRTYCSKSAGVQATAKSIGDEIQFPFVNIQAEVSGDELSKTVHVLGFKRLDHSCRGTSFCQNSSGRIVALFNTRSSSASKAPSACRVWVTASPASGGRAWSVADSSSQTPRTALTASATRRSPARSSTKRVGGSNSFAKSLARETMGVGSPRMIDSPSKKSGMLASPSTGSGRMISTTCERCNAQVRPPARRSKADFEIAALIAIAIPPKTSKRDLMRRHTTMPLRPGISQTSRAKRRPSTAWSCSHASCPIFASIGSYHHLEPGRRECSGT